MGGEDQRRFIRIPARLMTFIRFPKTGKVWRALTVDVSAGGIRLVTDELLEPGTVLELELKLPDREAPVACTAEVVRSVFVEGGPNTSAHVTVESALKFTQIDPKDQSLLLLYTRFNAPPM